MPSMAPRVAAVRRKPAHWMFGAPSRLPAASLPVAAPGDPIGLTVEIFVNGAWTDISSFVYYKNRIRITRGKPNETSQIQPQTCTFTINNRDGRFSPRNPLGPYYGQIGRNTPIRVSRLQNGVRRYRFHGEVPSWPTQYDISGTDVYGTVTAAGQMRRLFQGNQPLRSALFRAYTLGYGSTLQNITAPLRPIAYWPCEDSANAGSIASGLPGGTPMTLSGQAPPTFASNSVFACSAPLPLLAASIWTGTVPAYTGGTANVLRFLLSVPATGAYDGAVIARMYTAGTVARLDLTYGVVNNGSVQISGYDAFGNTLFANGYFAIGVNNTPMLWSMELLASGGNVQYQLIGQEPGGAIGIYFDFGLIAGTIGNASQVVINPDGHLNDTAVGHVSFQSAFDSIVNIYNALNGWLSESPILRFSRLCGEQNVPAVISFTTTPPGDSTAMGYQTINTFTTSIQQITDTLAAPIFEARDQLALALRSKGTLYNQPAKLTLDHSQHQLSGPLVPVDDDALTRNDVTVSRIGGSSNQQVLASGALSIQSPPSGVGDYPTNYNLSLSSDSLLADQAGWRLHLGTVDQPRFPNVPINLRHPAFTSNVDLMNAALTIDIGDRLVITNPPPWMPPDQISQLIQGYSETLGIFEHDMVFNCSPEDPYKVGLLEDTVLGRPDTDGSTLLLPAGAVNATLTVGTTSSASPLWTTNAADFPFDVNVGGERMTVTNIAAIGITNFAGADGTFESGVANWTPDANSTLVQSSAQAHSGTFSGLLTTVSAGAVNGTMQTPHIPVIANASYSVSGWFQKGVGASGGANIQILWYDASNTSLTNVAQGVNYTSGWQNVSYTAVAPPTAASAVILLYGGAASGTNSFYADDITLTPAIGPQLFTVTRSVNGVVKAQTAGTDVRLWQPMYLSL